MIHLSADMKAVVVGLGKSGLAALRYLHGLGLEVAVSEQRNRDELRPEEDRALAEYCSRFEGGGHSGEFCCQTDIIVVSPGVPLHIPALRDAMQKQIPVVGELALAAGRFRCKVIAVTGSNGKTTVTSLIAHMLRKDGHRVFLGGNIGIPVLEYLMNPDDYAFAVLELSSFQLQSAGSFRPDIGLLLNLSPDHLDWHGSMAAYAAAKMKMFCHQNGDDVAVLGDQSQLDLSVLPQIPEMRSRMFCFGVVPECRACVGEDRLELNPGFERKGAAEQYTVRGSSLASAVNLQNSAAAVLACRIAGCSVGAVDRGLDSFHPPEHRMTPVGSVGGVTFINDSKATNIGAVAAALGDYNKNVVLIAGGRAKGGDFSPLRPVVAERVKHLILLGETADEMAGSFAGVVAMERVTTMADAVDKAYGIASAGDTVLLAPACASFDMFANYSQRGEVFTQCVKALQRKQQCGQ